MDATKKNAILIVDDDQDILDMISAFLSDLPHDIITTTSAAEAIAILNSREIAVLISDLNMAGDLDGNKVLSHARQLHSDIVSVLMSGAMDRDAMLTALNEGGVSRYLEKPLDLDEVRKIVEEGITRYVRHSHRQASLVDLARNITVKVDRNDTKPIVVDTTDEPLPLNTLIGDRYRLLAVIGRGSTGIVYRAQDTFLRMIVALKILHPRLTRNVQEIAELKEEARIAMTLSHRNIVRLHNFDRRDGHHFLVMEYVEGRTLRSMLRQDGPFPLAAVVSIARTCSSALAYAHEHGVVHQDLKPENLLLSDSGLLKIIDFGLACLIGRQRDADHIAGTPIYMSPEQKRGDKVDARTDIYSLAVIFYELLKGQPPFPPNISATEALETDPEKLTGLPEQLTFVLETGMAVSPEQRWMDLADFTNAFAVAAGTT